jgi:hypothetical protein
MRTHRSRPENNLFLPPVRGRGFHLMGRAATPSPAPLHFLNTSEGREPAPTGQYAAFRISGDDSDLQLLSLGLAPQEVEIQGLGEKAHVPRDDKRDTPAVQPPKAMPDRSEVILGLQLYD